MRREPSVSTVFQAASFALFDRLRSSHDLALDRAGDLRATCVRQVDPAVRGLAFTNAGDAALELAMVGPDGSAHAAWIHATCDTRGTGLAVFLSPDRPSLQVRFGGPSLLPLEDGRYLLRERPTFPSHDGRQDERKDLAARLARPFQVPYLGGWLHLGCWDDLEGAWDAETPRRVLAAAVLLDRARGAAFA
jgi:hypothetical protein